MATRRTFLKGLVASAGLPAASWADAGHPAYLSAAQTPGGGYILCGLRSDGSLTFSLPLPDRGHAAAAHPHVPEAVAFARRPGTFALILDCMTGRVLHRLDAPPGRHFYGHGAFLYEGDLLCTTENDIETGEGRIGLWARAAAYMRVGEIASGGIGPHDILHLPGANLLAVANGGIRTHPDTGREKLNLNTMRPNLTIIGADGSIFDQAALPDDLYQNSLRHLAVNPAGEVACAFQWQGDPFAAPPLLAVYRDGTLTLADMSEAENRALGGYVGSVAHSRDGREIAVTSPRGGVAYCLGPDLRAAAVHRQADVCGVGATWDSFLLTDGLGQVATFGEAAKSSHDLRWDNHLIAI
ncbi:DUF1513 domain-containing protein [Aestuariibius sp. 2305UL40-4]|uniref:DUF1513 domain-containing protein n=1 Tax=Aestuariibius violaceus TaxID=3234132 RepID=UPI00345E1EB8